MEIRLGIKNSRANRMDTIRPAMLVTTKSLFFSCRAVLKAEADAREAAKKRRAQIEKRREAFGETAAFCERFCFAADGILIRPCRTEEELIREGKLLSHCVGMYADKIAAGKSMILFVRREDAPEVPWYTLELDLKDLQVLQNRGKRNCQETAEVAAFVRLWKKTRLEKKESAA